MKDELKNILAKWADGSEMDDDEFSYSERLKFAVSVLLDYPHYLRDQHVLLIMNQFGITRPAAHRLISEAIEVFPSMEKVSMAFERARISRFCYQFIMLCAGKGNSRDAAQYLKLLKEMWQLDSPDVEADVANVQIINMLKSSPESLGVELPEGFDLNKFITDLEKPYERKQPTAPTED